MMLLSLSDDYPQSQKNLLKPYMSMPFRSYSHELILHQSNHHRSDSTHSFDLFKLVVPKTNGSSLSSLTCSICSLPMMKPTLLPCQHTFCFKCIQNNKQIPTGSLPVLSPTGCLVNDQQTKMITCQKCFRTHRINSLADLEANRSMELLINTLLCETCNQLYSSNELDTCLHCFGVLCPNCYDDHLKDHHDESKLETNFNQILSVDQTVNYSQQTSDSQILKLRSINTEKTSTKTNKELENNENIDPSQMNHPKKKSTSFLRKIIPSSRHRHSNSISNKDSVTKSPSSSVKQSNSVKLPPSSKSNLTTKIEEISKTESIPSNTLPVTPVRRFKNLFEQYTHTAQHIQQCKQRQSELDRSVQKLIEVLTIKTNENIDRISYYWTYLKQLILDQYKTNPDHFRLFGYLIKTCCSPFDSRKQIEFYFQQNDEINAAIQVLSTTLTILNNQQTFITVNQLFDREEQTAIRTLRRQFENLLSSYTDELSFIVERMNVYESRFSSWKNSSTTDLDSMTSEWTQIVEHDYPALIEKIANDFITKVPQIEKILVQMLKNMKKRLLNATNPTPSRRTSES